MKDQRTIQGLLLFGVLFALFCGLLEYGRVLHLRPLPHHLWRQTVSLSITRNYHDQQLDFLDTQVSNLYLDKGWSGKAAGEFPLLYYGVSKLWNWTGRSEAAYRVVMLVLHALAALALFDLLRRILGRNGLAAMVALLFLASPALVYFALAFMTEVPAMDLLLIGAWALAPSQCGSPPSSSYSDGRSSNGPLRSITEETTVPLMLGWVSGHFGHDVDANEPRNVIGYLRSFHYIPS